MPPGTDNDEKIAEGQDCKVAWDQHCPSATLPFSLQATCLPAPIAMKTVAELQSCIWSTLPLCNLATLLFSHQATCLSAPITMKKLQSGKVAKPHVVKPATLQPCNPVIFTSGNMPVGTDNHDNSG
jgi:hypothetical protein